MITSGQVTHTGIYSRSSLRMNSNSSNWCSLYTSSISPNPWV
nr:MAG TPA: hypothetical protein [Caudoviricetes sp.]